MLFLWALIHGVEMTACGCIMTEMCSVCNANSLVVLMPFVLLASISAAIILINFIVIS